MGREVLYLLDAFLIEKLLQHFVVLNIFVPALLRSASRCTRSHCLPARAAAIARSRSRTQHRRGCDASPRVNLLKALLGTALGIMRLSRGGRDGTLIWR